MTDTDKQALAKINENIAQYEQDGNWQALRDCLAVQQLRTGGEAPVLAFRRATGACVDARAYLDAVSKSASRTTEITSITAEGDHIAIVRCVVEMAGNKFFNLRVFVREDAQSIDWKLLAWVNEPVN